MSNHFLFSDVLFTVAVIIFSAGVGLAVGLIWEIGHQTKLDRKRTIASAAQDVNS
jgi:hypothetical protein